MRIVFTVAGTPVGKGRPRTRVVGGKFAQVYTDTKTRNAEESFLAQALWCKPVEPLTKPLRVEMTFTQTPAESKSKKFKAAALAGEEKPTKKPDIDNLVKLVLDALNGVFFADDKQVVELEAVKKYGEVSKTTIAITEL